jgi:RHS repeat-associated protein
VKRITSGGAWTVYIGGIYEKRSNGTYVKYYSAFGRRIAMRDNAGVVHYILADHLGSSTVITDGSGVVVGTMKYYPYGAQRSVSGDMITDRLFTGQQREPQAISTLGLYNYGARFYSTLTGRFLSPDPFVPDPSEEMKKLEGALTVMQPLGFADLKPPVPTTADRVESVMPTPLLLNRYAYTLDNPLRYVDPDGLCFTPDMQCDPQIAFVFTVCGSGDAAGCTDALMVLGQSDPEVPDTYYYDLAIALFGSLEAYMNYVRANVQNPYFLYVSYPANNPIAAFTANPDPNSPLGQLIMRINSAYFYAGLFFAYGIEEADEFVLFRVLERAKDAMAEVSPACYIYSIGTVVGTGATVYVFVNGNLVAAQAIGETTSQAASSAVVACFM